MKDEVRDGTALEEARVGSGDEVAEEMALVVACLISCCSVRTAMLARPARPRLSKAMEKEEDPGMGPLDGVSRRCKAVCGCGCGGWARAYRARLSDRGAAATDSEVN